MEKSQFVDQNISARFAQINAFILANRRLFSTIGTVVASWRYYRGNRLGPFFKLAYRRRNRQSSLYLGRSKELAEEVRGLLAGLHSQRIGRRLRARIRVGLRVEKKRLQNELLARGYRLKGYEIHKSRKSCPARR